MATRRASRLILVAVLVGVAALVACRAPASPSRDTTQSSDPIAASATSAPGTAAGSGARVASTGPALPANGKPTFVFVDAIW